EDRTAFHTAAKPSLVARRCRARSSLTPRILHASRARGSGTGRRTRSCRRRRPSERWPAVSTSRALTPQWVLRQTALSRLPLARRSEAPRLLLPSGELAPQLLLLSGELLLQLLLPSAVPPLRLFPPDAAPLLRQRGVGLRPRRRAEPRLLSPDVELRLPLPPDAAPLLPRRGAVLLPPLCAFLPQRPFVAFRLRLRDGVLRLPPLAVPPPLRRDAVLGPPPP